MTKLEQKLIELGYKKEFEFGGKFIYFSKRKWRFVEIGILINKELNKIDSYRVDMDDRKITYYKEVDEINEAFNEMQKDLEELKSCQN